MSKTKLVVITQYGKECILGYIRPQEPLCGKYLVAGVLHGSVLRGAVCGHTVMVEESEFRLATVQDFEDYRVSSESYVKLTEEYEMKR
jgi:hypothetical protein